MFLPALITSSTRRSWLATIGLDWMICFFTIRLS